MHMSEQFDQSLTVYLLGHSVLDRLAYRRLLVEELGLTVCVDSDFRPTAVWAALRCQPQLALVDADVPRPEVTDALRMISRLRPDTQILLVSAAVEPAQIEPWSRCKLNGYVVKDGGIDELRGAIDALRAGREYYSPGIRQALTRSPQRTDGTVKLTAREAELLPLLARGMTLREAAKQMTISYKTADSYRSSLLRKLGIHDRVELARYAIRARIIDP